MTTTQVPTLLKSKVSLTTFKPKSYAASEYEKNHLLIGLMIGQATGVAKRTDTRTDEIYVGLKGNFLARVGRDPIKAPTELVSSGVCYLPDAFQGPIIEALEAEDSTGVVKFALLCYLCAAKNPAGYEWILQDLVPPTSVDPLTALVNEVTAQAITHEPEPAQSEAKQPAAPRKGR